MDFNKAYLRNSKGIAGRVFLFGLAVLVIIIIIGTILIFPKMSDFFLRKGVDFAAEKTIAVLPATEGFNPAIHNHDPLEARASFDALAHALNIKPLITDSLKNDVVDFMKTFRKCYDDQTIIPEEQTTIIAALQEVERRFLKNNFMNIRVGLLKQIEMNEITNPGYFQDVIGFDSVAIYNDKIRLGMTGPVSAELINLWYDLYADNNIAETEYEQLRNQLQLLDRFQLKNEFDATSKLIINTGDFAEFPNRDQFSDNCAIIISKLRDLDYDFEPIKATLKSFVLLWHEQLLTENEVQFNLEPLYQFTVYAKDHVLQN